MKSRFSRNWLRSTQVRKQRKYRHNAPLHLRRKFVSANLSKELRTRHGRRSFPLRTGDTVKVLRGKFKGVQGKVTKVMLDKCKVNVEKVESTKKDGSKVSYPLAPSNLMITNLILEDDRRVKALNRGKKGEQ